MFPRRAATANRMQIVMILYFITPAAVSTPAVNINPPEGKKKQKNNPVCANTKRKTSNRPPFLISASVSKIFNKPPRNDKTNMQYCLQQN
jgi:hypothetical protein